MNQKFVKYYSIMAMSQRMGKSFKENDINNIKNDYIDWLNTEKNKNKKKVRKIK